MGGGASGTSIKSKSFPSQKVAVRDWSRAPPKLLSQIQIHLHSVPFLAALGVDGWTSARVRLPASGSSGASKYANISIMDLPNRFIFPPSPPAGSSLFAGAASNLSKRRKTILKSLPAPAHRSKGNQHNKGEEKKVTTIAHR